MPKRLRKSKALTKRSNYAGPSLAPKGHPKQGAYANVASMLESVEEVEIGVENARSAISKANPTFGAVVRTLVDACDKALAAVASKRKRAARIAAKVENKHPISPDEGIHVAAFVTDLVNVHLFHQAIKRELVVFTRMSKKIP